MVLHRPYYQEILDCVSGASKLTASYGEICEKENESECKSTVTFSNTITDRSPPLRPQSTVCFSPTDPSFLDTNFACTPQAVIKYLQNNETHY